MCVQAFQSNPIWILKKPSVVIFKFKGESLFGYMYFFHIFVLAYDYFTLRYSYKFYLSNHVL